MKKRWASLIATGAALVLASGCGNTSAGQESGFDTGGEMILATTTSTYDTGLLDELIPVFEEETGVNVKIIAVGSGQALAMGEEGEADALLAHAPEAEEELEADGKVINRHRVMHNDFIVAGPDIDPAGISGLPVEEAFAELANQNGLFFSRGDDSGTHKKELDIWSFAGTESVFDNYKETGQGMGDTLRIASEREGYTLTDRGTYLFQKENLDNLAVLNEGDESLENIYHVMQVSPDLSEKINEEAAEAFVDFFLSEETQSFIKTFGEEEWGQPLFFIN
ncbi:substrate-binding domain-containing protein [Evansella sp. LMS18]|uniref:substrate-binding domain-containing protein n=1 Tax=Evansella sp. LMS18 TaxID=2924033 RepID=UPI0020D0B078|nr:substrate-binding domain-containing protein [Evansella sp. LMS18]UTR09186.1 substrate-binding domain-containing protein [Evansella sp. LMS18]